MSLSLAPSTADAPPELIEFVDFKWLMFGEGHQVHLERLQADRAYARACLALAGSSVSPTLRDCAARLGRALGLVVPAA